MALTRTLSLFGMTLLLALGAQAQGQWKWRDAQGQVQYSDRPPPPGTPEKDILARPANARPLVQIVPYGQPASAAAPAPSANPASAAADKRAAEERAKQAKDAQAKLKAQEEQTAALRADNCKAARQHLATLESGIRLVQTNEKGERIVLDDSMRAAELAKAKAVIASDCR